MKTNEKFVAYYRVSTQKQGIDGYGADAQRTDIRKFLNGKSPIAEFQEIESGRKIKRPELEKAIQVCKDTSAVLVIGKLDRLARNVSFVCKLRDTGVKFVATDNPNANELTINIIASVAQEEARLISERTKAALKEKVERLRKYGLPENWRNAENQKWNEEARKKAKDRIKEKASENKNTKRAKKYATQYRYKLDMTLQDIADELNRFDFASPNEKKFRPTTVWRLIGKKKRYSRDVQTPESKPEKKEVETEMPKVYRRAIRTHEPKDTKKLLSRKSKKQATKRD